MKAHRDARIRMVLVQTILLSQYALTYGAQYIRYWDSFPNAQTLFFISQSGHFPRG